jgi:hypothetical protein
VIARRAAALVAALVMIGVSIAVRSLVFDNDSHVGAVASGATLHLACVTELANACDEIARTSGGRVKVTVEPAGITAKRMVDATDATKTGIDGWLTIAPWPEIVGQRRARANATPVLGRTSPKLARTPLVIAIRNDRYGILRAACGREIDWTCTGNQAGKPWSQLGGDVRWGNVKPAHAEPIESATGLVVLGHAVGEFLASPKLPIEQVSSNDWQASSAFPGWFQRLETNIPADALAVGADPLTQWLQQQGVNAALVGGLEANIAPRLAQAGALKNEVRVIYPAAVASADVVFAPIKGRGDDLGKIVSADAARAAFVRAGWRVGRWGPPLDAGASVPPLPTSNGLPPAGTLDALQTYWQGIRR